MGLIFIIEICVGLLHTIKSSLQQFLLFGNPMDNSKFQLTSAKYQPVFIHGTYLIISTGPRTTELQYFLSVSPMLEYSLDFNTLS